MGRVLLKMPISLAQCNNDELKDIKRYLRTYFLKLRIESLFSNCNWRVKMEKKKEIVKKGIGFGSCLAMVISFTTWKSIGWAIIHGIFGWLYVLYFIIKY